MVGYWYRKIPWYVRIIAFLTGLSLMYPGTMTDIIGFTAFALLIILQFVIKGGTGKNKEAESTS